MPTCYRIHIKEQLDPHWAAWPDDMNLTYAADGATILEGRLVDQAALYGLISKLRDLGLRLISVQPLAAEHPGAPE
jgi:hypothetical protein